MPMQKEPIEEVDSGSWMDTYGDLVTLLLCFFVLLFASSTVDAAKWQQLVRTFSGTPTVVDAINPGEMVPMAEFLKDMPTPEPDDASAMEITSAEQLQDLINQGLFDDLYERIVAYIDIQDLEMFIVVERDGTNKITIRFTDSLLFDSGRANLKPNGVVILDALMPILVDSQDSIAVIRVEGHTDNVPISSVMFPSNWELSAVRASTVTRHILENTDLDPTLLQVAGYGEYRPIATNGTEEGKQKNRRVDLVVERKLPGTSVAQPESTYALPPADGTTPAPAATPAPTPGAPVPTATPAPTIDTDEPAFDEPAQTPEIAPLKAIDDQFEDLIDPGLNGVIDAIE